MAQIIKFPIKPDKPATGEWVDELVWFCNCGCQFFQITETGIYCRDCHARQDDLTVIETDP